MSASTVSPPAPNVLGAHGTVALDACKSDGKLRGEALAPTPLIIAEMPTPLRSDLSETIHSAKHVAAEGEDKTTKKFLENDVLPLTAVVICASEVT
mgnify:CR=1 FL=1